MHIRCLILFMSVKNNNSVLTLLRNFETSDRSIEKIPSHVQGLIMIAFIKRQEKKVFSLT